MSSSRSGDLPSDFFERLAKREAAQNLHTAIDALRGDRISRLRSGEYVVVAHADVLQVLREPQFLKPVPLRTPFRSIRCLFRMFFMLNPPDHTRLRKTVAPLFSSVALERRAARVETVSHELIEGKTDLEVIHDLAYPLPLRLIAEWLGVRQGDLPQLGEWSRVMSRALDRPAPILPSAFPRFAKSVLADPGHLVATLRTARAIVRYAQDRIRADDDCPDADMLALLREAFNAGTMTLDEAAGSWILFVIAGHETTANLIGNTVYELLGQPDQHRLVQEEPALLPAAIEETLRHESPVNLALRVTGESTTVADTKLPAGSVIFAVLSGANRDPARYEDPAKFDVRRDASSHLALGQGPHFCMGAQLSKTEAQAALRALLDRSPRLAQGCQPMWRASFATRGLESLPVHLEN